MMAGPRRVGALKPGLVFAVLLVALLAPALARAAKPGHLDRSFGDHGRAKAAYGAAGSVAIDAEQRPVLAGTYFDIARLRPNGTPDQSFGSDGVASTPFLAVGGYPKAYGRSMVIDSQNRIVVGGSLCRYADSDYFELIGCQAALARHEPDGGPDDSFGDGGAVTLPCQRRCEGKSVAVDSRDRIIFASTNGGPATLRRYEVDGSLDRSFGDGGKVKTDVTFPSGQSMTVDSRDRILLAGSIDDSLALARYGSDGRLDPSFGSEGVATARFGGPSGAHAVAIRPHSRIVVAGYVVPGRGSSDFAIASFKPNGRPSHSFSRNGKLTTSFGPRPYDGAGAVSVAFDSRRRTVAVGNACRNSYRCNFALARYRPDGRIDRSFGSRGKATAPGNYAIVNAAAIDSRDRIYVAGGHGRFQLARFIGYRRR